MPSSFCREINIDLSFVRLGVPVLKLIYVGAHFSPAQPQFVSNIFAECVLFFLSWHQSVMLDTMISRLLTIQPIVAVFHQQ